jgi:hypothetical protein
LQLFGAGLRRVGAAQQRLDPRHQFAAAQRLDQVVVGAGRDAGHDVVLGAAADQEHHGRVGRQFFAGAAQHVGGRHVVRVPVDDQQVGAVLAQVRQQILGAVIRLAAVARARQDLANQLRLAAVVVQDGYSHDSLCT